ncbi:MAG: methylated-DNA-[protein]-cysteine S-methyltransferase [Candidatus Endobugula sp.]|jgi:methylated-DNA-[protein]-cysteine S-methyltransferase
MTYIDTIMSPLGTLQIEASNRGLTRLVFVDELPTVTSTNPVTDEAKQQLQDYFTDKQTSFDVPLDPKGTDFQQSVWRYLATIPYGQTVSYQDVANGIDNPKAVRAVGAANGKNPIAIIVPCHRVIGKDGSLTGYAWGVETKLWLLKHEKETNKKSK